VGGGGGGIRCSKLVGPDGDTPTTMEPGDEPLEVVTNSCAGGKAARGDCPHGAMLELGEPCVAAPEGLNGNVVSSAS
jgi:hypothetical protein